MEVRLTTSNHTHHVRENKNNQRKHERKRNIIK